MPRWRLAANNDKKDSNNNGKNSTNSNDGTNSNNTNDMFVRSVGQCPAGSGEDHQALRSSSSLPLV